MPEAKVDEEMKAFAADVRESIAQAKRGEVARAQPRATAARYDARKKVVVIELANGASFAFPPSLAQGLEGASTADLSDIAVSVRRARLQPEHRVSRRLCRERPANLSLLKRQLKTK